MKYFFSLLLVGLISFNVHSSYAIKEFHDETDPASTISAKQRAPATETGSTNTQNPATNGTPANEIAEGQPKAEERVAKAEEAGTQQRPDAKPAEERATIRDLESLLNPDRKPGETDSAILQATDKNLETMSLRETNIGRAILEGNIDSYAAALKELTEVFGTSLQSILQKKTIEGDTILDLMIETTKNREFFTGEMFYLLIFHVLIDTSISRSLSQIQLLFAKAKQVNNVLAVKLLSNLNTLVTKHENSYLTLESTYNRVLKDVARQKKLKEQAIELVKNHYSKTSIALDVGFTALAGVLIGWGYKLFTNASPDTASYAPQISEFLSKVSDKEISIATMAIGAALAAAGINQCGKAFWRWRKVNNIRKQY